jgi:hypothetical protein
MEAMSLVNNLFLGSDHNDVHNFGSNLGNSDDDENVIVDDEEIEDDEETIDQNEIDEDVFNCEFNISSIK